MKANDILKELVEKDGRSKVDIAEEMGITSANLINRTKRGNVSVDSFTEMINSLGYEIIIRPKQRKHKENEIEITKEV